MLDSVPLGSVPLGSVPPGWTHTHTHTVYALGPPVGVKSGEKETEKTSATSFLPGALAL